MAKSYIYKPLIIFLMTLLSANLVFAAAEIYLNGKINLPINCSRVLDYRIYLQEEGSKLAGTIEMEAHSCWTEYVCMKCNCNWKGGSSCIQECDDSDERVRDSLIRSDYEILTGSVTGSLNGNAVDLIITTNIDGRSVQFSLKGTMTYDASGKTSFSGYLDSSITCEPGVYVKGSVTGEGLRREKKPVQSDANSTIFLAGKLNLPSGCRYIASFYTLTLTQIGSNISGSIDSKTWHCRIDGFCNVACKCRFISSDRCINTCQDDRSLSNLLIRTKVESVSGNVVGTIKNNVIDAVANTQYGELRIGGVLQQESEGRISFSGNLDSSITCEPGVYVKGRMTGEGLRNELTKRKIGIGDNCSDEIKCDEGKCVNGVCRPEPKCLTGATACGSSCCMPSQTCNGSSCLPVFCKGGLTQCGLTCVNTSKDRFNCGSCGVTCKPDEYCSNGKCISYSGLGGIDRNNCGQAGIKCNDNQICANGSCIECQNNLTRCGNSCVNLNSDPSNCGQCGESCSANQFCSNGKCISASQCVLNSIQYAQCGKNCCDLTQWCDTETMTCLPMLPISPPGDMPAQCGPFVVDLSSDRQNCGMCFNACASDQKCTNGICTLVETCGNGRCGANETCSNCPSDCGSCIETGCLGEYPTLCGNICVNTANDSQNCGSCGAKCQPTQICLNGKCIGALNSECRVDADCLYGYCVNSTCRLRNCLSDSECGRDEYCSMNLGVCDGGCRTSPDNCNLLLGSPGRCDPQTRECIGLTCPYGTVLINNSCFQITIEACNQSEQCQSGICLNNRCISTDNPIAPVESATKIGKPSFGSGAAAKSSPKLFAIEENQAASEFLYSLLGTSKSKLLAYDSCLRGSICSTSDDCCGAPCLGSRCACSNSVCTTTADCCSGYCENGKCSSAPYQKLSLFSSLTSQNLGCAGLIEECSPGEKTCISLCNGISLLLVLVAGSFGAFTWTRFKHPVAGLVAAFVPIVIGLAFYPFVGIVSGIILFSLLVYKDTGSIEV
ncbi:MAG: hypothetical protein N3G74_00380 [Candidatus Micrarchaeota archaeon]|nr:hypothetical protein [Candidatus Micrarchaeota archaeon]